MITEILKVKTSQNKEAVEITDLVNDLITKSKVKSGLCHLFVKHTTAALTTGEVGEGTDEDLLEIVQKMIPKINFRHLHNPEHAPDHMVGSVVGPSLTIPISGGQLDLGHWQRVLLIEMNGPRQREIVVTIS